jgi:hypothetical protein
VNPRPKSVVQEICTLRSVGGGGRRLPPPPGGRPVMGVPTANNIKGSSGCAQKGDPDLEPGANSGECRVNSFWPAAALASPFIATMVIVGAAPLPAGGTVEPSRKDFRRDKDWTHIEGWALEKACASTGSSVGGRGDGSLLFRRTVRGRHPNPRPWKRPNIKSRMNREVHVRIVATALG